MTVVATIGNFDGVHIGHQALIKAMLERAKAHKAKTCLILLEPYPREFFQKEAAPPRIQTLSDKLLKLQQWPIDCIHIVRFNARVAEQSPQDFIDETLKKLQIVELIVGEDFRFGKNRQGSLADIKAAGITVIAVPDIIKQQERVSSSKIRTYLSDGDFKTAANLLGEPYQISGRVIHGAKHGRLLGFPTLNIALRKKVPLTGVYEVKVYGLEGVKQGVANVGRRPTLNPLAHPLLEVYVLDFDKEVYGKRLSIEFIRKIRDEKKFESLDALKAQIQADIFAVQHP